MALLLVFKSGSKKLCSAFSDPKNIAHTSGFLSKKRYFHGMKRLSVRVYGIWINEQNQILLSDERMGTLQFTKFPGGGLEWGEGTKDCLQREWQEELNVTIDIGEHLYTTDFFQLSAFDQVSQIISIYYRVTPHNIPLCDFKTKIFDFENTGDEETIFRWCPLSRFSADVVTLPIDKIVAELIRQQ